MEAQDRIYANAQEIKRLKAALKRQAREREMELLFLREVIKARELQAQLGDAPKGPWKGLDHNHICNYCNETWRCDCIESNDYMVSDHGCKEQQRAAKSLAIALAMPDKWAMPYLSRYAKPKRKTKADGVAAQIAANDVEIARLRKELGQ
jgi:hypothetical protein